MNVFLNVFLRQNLQYLGMKHSLEMCAVLKRFLTAHLDIQVPLVTCSIIVSLMLLSMRFLIPFVKQNLENLKKEKTLLN